MNSYIEDSKEQIDMCLSCPLDECINCLDPSRTIKSAEDEVTKKIKELKSKSRKLKKREINLLKAYPFSKTDYDLAERLGTNQSTVCTIRKRLGLPPVRWTNLEMRKAAAALWLEE